MIEQLLQTLYPWIDAIWFPITFFVVHKPQRIWALGYIFGCFVILRMQAELMVSIGYPNGLLPFMQSDVFTRGLITYSVFHALYLLLAYFSPGSHKHVMMAASISIFFAAMFVSSFVMLL